jgi:hypothetical protein
MYMLFVKNGLKKSLSFFPFLLPQLYMNLFVKYMVEEWCGILVIHRK